MWMKNKDKYPGDFLYEEYAEREAEEFHFDRPTSSQESEEHEITELTA